MSVVGAPQVVFVAGLSGSGKSTAMAALEDLAFYCVDNLPAQLIEQFLHLCKQGEPPIEKIALAVDTREPQFLKAVPAVVERLRQTAAQVEVVFLDCAQDVLEKRYRETRRVHPHAPEGTVARPMDPSSSITSTSTVGLPRLSRISRPRMSTMAVMGVSLEV